MSTATLATPSATQLTFPWALPESGDAVRRASSPTVPASRSKAKHTPAKSKARTAQPIEKALPLPASEISEPCSAVSVVGTAPVIAAPGTETVEVAGSVAESLQGDRLCKPVRIGAVMFRLLKSYGITDEEIAEGVAAYASKHA